MLREFLQKKKGGQQYNSLCEDDDVFGAMEQPKLSLGPSSPSSFLTSDTDAKFARKRKPIWEEQSSSSSIELQLQAPLPPDWEQCLDLQSGRMYYVNRRTLKKSWEWPREAQMVDLELNISTTPTSTSSSSATTVGRSPRHTGGGNPSRMVAVPCLRCHLLVMLSTSSPSCPNCKFVHSLADLQRAPSPRPGTSKPLQTLRLLH